MRNKKNLISISGLILFLLVISQPSVFAGGQRRRIQPGKGIVGKIELGMIYNAAMEKYGGGKSPRDRGEGKLLNISIRLFLDNNKKIIRLITDNPEFNTPNYIHVFSKLKDVFLAYGKAETVEKQKGEISLKYLSKGITFNIETKTKVVKSIEIYESRANK